MTKITFLGSGDAFSAGGRFYSSLLVNNDGKTFLIDVGPTTSLALRQIGISFEQIDYIFLTHSHGDHLGGLPFLFLEFQYRVNRKTPITIVGAPGISEYAENVVSTMYASLSKENRKFAVRYQSINGQPYHFAAGKVEGFFMTHELYSRGYKFELGGKAIAVTGDTEWTNNIIALANNADLLIIECSFFDRNIPGHLSYKTLEEKLPLVNCKNVILYHLGQEVLDRQGELRFELANDLMEIQL
ncbi:MAG: MBL fold metallo-hydrolase [Candidatus Hodarchaeota archaeon]